MPAKTAARKKDDEIEIIFVKAPPDLKLWLRNKAEKERRSMSDTAVIVLEQARERER